MHAYMYMKLYVWLQILVTLIVLIDVHLLIENKLNMINTDASSLHLLRSNYKLARS